MGSMELDMKKVKISFIINIIIVLCTIIASIMMFIGFRFMSGKDIALASTKISMFKFFTVDSNIFMGIVALIFSIDEYKLLSGKIKEISIKKYTLKLMATVSVALTFFTVLFYLGPISEGGIYSMLLNSNLFFHLIIPFLSIINFIMFENSNKLKFKHCLYGTIPMLFYSIFYMLNVFLHVENGKVTVEYDWYWFVQNGIWTCFIVVPIIYILTFIISFLSYKLNNKFYH